MFTCKSDFDRVVEPHEPHYFMAQERGFTLIREIEQCLMKANSYAGHYTGYLDPVTHDLVLSGECDEPYDDAMRDARCIASMAARSNGYRILRAQGRTDEVAQLVFDAHAQIHGLCC